MGFLSKSSKTTASQNNALGQVGEMPVQAKLRYGQVGDSYEQEADRVADAIVNSPGTKANRSAAPALGNSISNYVQREPETKPAQEEENSNQKTEENKKEEKAIQKKETNKEEEKAVQKKDSKKEEEKPVQRKATEKKDEDKKIQKKENKEEEKKPVQKKSDTKQEEKPIQKKEDKKEEKPIEKKDDKKEEKTVQKKESDNPKAEEPDIERQIIATKTGGRILEDDVRKEMEQQFGKDFKTVRIHNDPQSHELCRKINAQAFTHGNHIYFAEGKYDPQSTEGKRLLAHELTHVVQQGHDVRRMIQKTNGTGAGGSGGANADLPVMVNSNTYRSDLGIITKSSNTIDMPELRVPRFKQPFTPANNLTIRKGRPEGVERQTSQRNIWDQSARSGTGLDSTLDAKLNQAAPFGDVSNPVKYMKVGNQGNDETNFLVGNKTTIKNRLLRPYWQPNGTIKPFEVDHKLEYQLNGADDINNLWLLERDANGASGRNIASDIESKVNRLLSASANTEVWNNGPSPSFASVKRDYNITFRTVNFNLPAGPGTPATYTLDDIKDGRQLNPVHPLSLQQVNAAGLRTDATHIVIFNNAAGGRRFRINLPSSTAIQVPFTDQHFLPGFRPAMATINPGGTPFVMLQGQLFSRNPLVFGHNINMQVAIDPLESVPNTGRLNVSQMRSQIESLLGGGNIEVKPFSPIRMQSFDVDGDGNMIILCKVITNIPIIDGADIDLVIHGNDFRIQKTFYGDEFKIPGPVKVPSSSITFAIGTQSGISVSGSAAIEIKNVARGQITAAAQTGTGNNSGFSISGHLDFDSNVFNPARLRVHYENRILTVGGALGIPEGKIRGIKRANIDATYSTEGSFSASGSAEMDVRGVSHLTVNASYANEQLTIEGDATLTNDIPGIRGGNVHARVTKNPAGEWNIAASGTAQPAIPGIESTLSIEYDNGALRIEGQASYNRGLLSGSIRVGATNRAIGPDGQPTGNPTDRFIVYGGGQLTVRITPWLQGTIGVNFLPNGEMEVSGRIAIPAPLDVFARREIPERDIFSIGVDIPIFAIPLGPRSIGLKATISGALKVYAGIGPGRLEQLELGITYNPDHPDDAHVTGTGRFVVPADAGLKLAVRASVGIDAGIAGVEGGFEVAGGLGLRASASADVSIDWTPNSGLELNASLNADVQPVFTFNIDGFVHAWVLFYDKEWRWRLANYEYGSNLNFGVTLPVHYKEGEAFNISYEDIQFRRPEIDANSFVGGLLRSLRH